MLRAVLAYSVAILFVSGVAGFAKEGDERLIGWQGETYKPQDVPQDGEPHIFKDGRKPWIQVLSWKPRAFVYHNFLSQEEAVHIIKIAAPQMKRSTVVGANNNGVVDDIRTSAGTFLMRNQDPVIAAIEHRLSIWTQLPPSHQEDMQVLRYGPTNKYGPHIDGLERVCTVLIYLVEPEEGGETAFPSSNGWLHPEMGEPTQGNFSKCAQGHVAYKPKRGDALLFYDVTPDYLYQDGYSMHTGCPVVKGVKWNAVKWIHGKPFRGEDYARALKVPYVPLPDPGLCADLEQRCKNWAESGECERNPGYMIGTGSNSGQGMCRKACNSCRDCAEGDQECYSENREKGGFMNFESAELKIAEVNW